MSDAHLPLMFGNYLIEARIGQGGMGVVYRARHTYLDRLAALKIVNEPLVRTPAARERFLREALTAARLKHANLAQVYDYGEDGGRAYLAMEYVEGLPLDEVLLAGPMSPTRALALLDQVASALDYIHRQGVVHRDLKPSNIMVTHDDLAVVVDFGIARILETATASQDGQIVGTLAYCAPEQLQEESADASGGRLCPRRDRLRDADRSAAVRG
ncbi:MAG: serine/threonine-protein kinase [Dehalococcoidia bacterium]